MSKKGSNKGIYIFWGGIAVVIAIILLIIFIPKTNTKSMEGYMVSIVATLEKTDKNGRTIDAFAQSFILDPDAESNKKTNLTCLNKLWHSLTLSNDFSTNALLYVSADKGYKVLSKKQNQDYKKLNASLNEFHDYCTNYVTSLFNGTGFGGNRPFTVNETLDVFLSKYTEVLNQMAEFYHTSAMLINDFSVECMEINPTMQAKHLENTTSVKNALAKSVISTSEVSAIRSNAGIIYAYGYYKSFI